MAIIRENIPVHKHFLIIDSPVPFTLIVNNGTDEVYRMAGAWRLDLWKLLPSEYMKQYPGYRLDIQYDDTNLGGGTVVIRQSDIDLGEGIAGVNGQEVYVTNLGDLPIKQVIRKKLSDFNFLNPEEVYNFFTNINFLYLDVVFPTTISGDNANKYIKFNKLNNAYKKFENSQQTIYTHSVNFSSENIYAYKSSSSDISLRFYTSQLSIYGENSDNIINITLNDNSLYFKNGNSFSNAENKIYQQLTLDDIRVVYKEF